MSFRWPAPMEHVMEDERLRILAVADNRDDYAATRALLVESGRVACDLEWTESYDDALEAFKGNSHDVYLLDGRFATRTGMGLLREAVAIGCKAPIILLSGRDDPAEEVTAIKAGAADYLVKGELSAPLLERSIRYALERKRCEDALEKVLDAAMESACVKSQFLANMSHEMKTPLNAITGMIDLVLDSDLTHRQHENLMLARFSADSLLHLINDILDFSTVESGRLCLWKRPLTICGTLEKALSPLQVTAEQKGLRLVKRIPADLSELLIGDGESLTQILTKLAGNAVKFTESGEVTITVELMEADEAGVLLHWMVSDTGMGIPADRMGKIFQTFTQGDGSLSRKHGGTGLGLSIVRNLVAMLGGEVWAESEVGGGSRFHFTTRFAAQRGTGAAAPGAKGDGAELSLSTGSLNILLAEDSLVNQMIFAEMLGKSGHRVAVAADGRRAVEAFQKGRFDIVLMDIQMPVMDGYEATRAIRILEAGKGGYVPIIALTGSDFKGDREKCLSAGMDGYMAKPLREEELAVTLAGFVAAARAGGGDGGRPLDGTPVAPERLLDPEVALENLGGNRALLQEITALFMKEAPVQIGLLREAVDGGDDERIERSAHKLKGMAANVGAEKLADEAFRIQLAVRKGDREKTAATLQHLERMFDQLNQELTP